MIERSFIFLDGIGERTERKIWASGVADWTGFLSTPKVRGISSVRKKCFDEVLLGARHALFTEDSSFFLTWPSIHMWRLYDFFRDETLFLDIEIGSERSDVLVVGLFDSYNTMVMVKGYNMDKELLLATLSRYKLLVTFNGSSFDLPALEKFFGCRIALPHIDLKHCCLRLGLTGGLKEIEKKLSIVRPKHLYGNPVDLWRAFHASGDQEYLDLLLAYNEEDVVNLKPLMEYCYDRLREKVCR